MKKFLSSLLALTMILSLVIVPANAASDTMSGLSLTASKETVKVGESVTLTVSGKPTVNGSTDTMSIASGSNYYSFKWTVSGDGLTGTPGKGATTNALTAEKAGDYTVQCVVTYKGPVDYDYTEGTGTQTLTTKVTVESDKPADTYTVSKPVITVKTNNEVTNETSFPKGTALSFSVAAPTVTKNGETMANGYDLEYTWTGATAGKDTSTATATPTEKGSLNVTCTVKVKVDGKQVATATSATTKLTITDPQEAFEKAPKTVTYKGRSYHVKNDEVTIDLFGSETIANADLAVSATGVAVEKGTFTAAEGNNDATLVIKSKDNSELTVTVTLRTNAVKGAKVNIKKDGKVVTDAIEIVTPPPMIRAMPRFPSPPTSGSSTRAMRLRVVATSSLKKPTVTTPSPAMSTRVLPAWSPPPRK